MKDLNQPYEPASELESKSMVPLQCTWGRA